MILILNIILICCLLLAITCLFYFIMKSYEQSIMDIDCQKGNLELVKYHINQGKYLSINSSLIIAIKAGHVEIVKFLLTKMDKTNYDDYMKIALGTNNKEIVQILIENKVMHYEQAIEWIVYRNHLDLFNIYLEKNNYVNSDTLFVIVQLNRLKMIEVLLEKETISLSKIMEEASEQGNMKIIKFLYTYTKIDYKNCYPAFQRAIENYQYDIVQFFVEKGCRLHEKDIHKYGPVAKTILMSKIV